MDVLNTEVLLTKEQYLIKIPNTKVPWADLVGGGGGGVGSFFSFLFFPSFEWYCACNNPRGVHVSWIWSEVALSPKMFLVPSF